MRVRPLARREASTARPPRVAIRARKPCFLARLRTFGWKVRFDMKTPFTPGGYPVGATAGEGLTVRVVVDKSQSQPPLLGLPHLDLLVGVDNHLLFSPFPFTFALYPQVYSFFLGVG